MAGKKRIKVSKRINQYNSYILYDIILSLWGEWAKCCALSQETTEKFNEFAKSFNRDLNHLECDEYTEIYIVECGYNYE